MPGMSFAEAKSILDAFCKQEDGKMPSANKRAMPKRNEEACDESWWTENPNPVRCDSPRSRAYLAAYVEIANQMYGEPKFYASGIPVERGFIHPDRKIMKSMLQDGYVILKNCMFELTDAGRDLVSRVCRPATL